MLRFARDAFSTIVLGTPLNVRFWVTRRCNYRCVSCSAWEQDPGEEMDLAAIRRALRNLRRTRVRQVVLTGGEPTLRPDIVEIVEACAQAGFRVRLQTNAARHVTEELLDRCFERGLSDLAVSLDTLDAELQDELCHGKDVVENATRVLRYAATRHGRRGVISANVVMSARNFRELPRMVRFTRELGIFFGPCIFTRSFTSNTVDERPVHELDLRKVPADVRESVFDELFELYRKDYPILTASKTLVAMREFMRNGSMAWSCRAGEMSFDILPSGELAACCEKKAEASEEPVANLLRDDFEAVYRSDAFKDKCRRTREGCPGCLYACYRDPVYLSQDNPTRLEALGRTIRYNKWTA